MAETLDQLYDEMLQCQACKLRGGCSRVVPAVGQRTSPAVMICGEAPGQQEDEQGEPFVGRAGEVLREVLRKVGLNRSNTLITNVVKCRPPGNKFPTDDCPDICVSKWLSEEIRLAQPKRLILVGSKPLEYVAKLDGITKRRGQWITAQGVRSMATYHPSYVLRQENAGFMAYRDTFAADIAEVAKEVK
jgi:DNA polymerase